MPRQDVPYGGAICRLKERIAELFDLVGQKLHSINGVQGDGQGDVKILSDDPVVVITNDAAQNEIKIGLDSSELPSAAVQSVNGQTGAVALDAGDIPSDNGDVQADLDALALRVTANGTAISNEVIDRQNADAALQTNINAALASIPEMSVTPDPYKGVERDAQGRAFAADPASGATDKSLTTANWISQTGNSAPNNLIHKTGDETKNGQLITTANMGFMCERPTDFSIAFTQKNTTVDRTSTTDIIRLIPLWIADKNNNQMLSLRYTKLGKYHSFFIRIIDTNGTEHDQVLFSFTEP